MMGESNITWIDRSDLLHLDTSTSFVYRVRDVKRGVIYVGSTGREPGGRFMGYASLAAWWGDAASVEVCEVPSQEAAGIEGAEIHRWHPVGNKLCPVCKSRYYPQSGPRVPRAEYLRVTGFSLDQGKIMAARDRLALSRLDLIQKVSTEYRHILPKGLSKEMLKKAEYGERRVSPAILLVLAMALECEPANLIQ